MAVSYMFKSNFLAKFGSLQLEKRISQLPRLKIIHDFTEFATNKHFLPMFV